MSKKKRFRFTLDGVAQHQLYHNTYLNEWPKFLKAMRAQARLAHEDGHKLEGWRARVNETRHVKCFVAVCKKCRAVYIAELVKDRTWWLETRGMCRATPKKIVKVATGTAATIGGEVMTKGGFKRTFV